MDFNKLNNDLDQEKISPYQIYNLDVDYPQFFAVDHYLKNENDNIDQNQKIQKVFLDIEVYSENKFDFDRIETGEHPISAFTIFSSYEKVFNVFILLIQKNVDIWNTFPNHIEYFKEQLIKGGYIEEDQFDINVRTYTNDLPLIKDVFEKIHSLDPVILTGWNSDFFDLPYIYYRLKYLYNNDLKSVSKILSKFGDVTVTKFGGNQKVRLIEYINADMSYLYRPRDDGGLGLGRKQPSYSLDYVSEYELKKKKLEYKQEGMVLDTFYEKDPINYVLYNIIDVCLVHRLDQKLKIIDQFNMYRRLMQTPLDIALRGPTVLFDTLVYYQLAKDKNYIRFGINEETQESISSEDIVKIPKPLTNRTIKWTVKEIDKHTYLKITRKFEGAYVKFSPGRIYDTDDGLIIDLDASSLYPSMIRQNNISFDTYYGRILDPETTTKIIDLLDQILRDRKKFVNKSIHSNILDLVVKYITSDKITVTNANDAIQQYYYITSYLFDKITNSKAVSIKEIFQPRDYYHYIILKKYLITLINLIDEIHQNNNEYNNFCYDYLLNNETKHKSIYIIENINQSNICIRQLLSDDLDKYLKDNNLILTLTGCLFYKHERKTSLFTNWLERMATLRKQYIKERDKYPKESDEYNFFNARQLATKTAMNTSYGLYGQSTFRYSNNWLAKTITCQGRLALKISQQVAEDYLKEFSK